MWAPQPSPTRPACTLRRSPGAPTEADRAEAAANAAVENATHFFWGSIEQYRTVESWLPRDAQHACGAGKTAVAGKAADLGIELTDEQVVSVLDQIKAMEHQGYHFEAADGSFELMLRQASGWTQHYFELESFRVYTERRADEVIVAEATVKLIIKGQRMITTGEGNGPVNALDEALRSALRTHYPEVSNLRLTNCRVRVLDSNESTGATVRVFLETSDGIDAWGTIGVHPNVIQASWEALVDGIVLGLFKAGV